MADRGDDTLRFGPLKPVGLTRSAHRERCRTRSFSCARRTARAPPTTSSAFRRGLTWPAQREAFGKLPGLAGAEWLRLGVMHRNTFIDSPRLLDARLKLRGTPALYFAGQITGAEGYVEAAACGAMTGIHAAREILGLPPVEFPRDSAFGAVVAHLQNRDTPDFQPSNVTWGSFDAKLESRAAKVGKQERRRMMARARARGDRRVRR